MRINTGVAFDLSASAGASRVDVITELMEGHEAGSPIAGDGRAQVISEDGALTLFSVGTDGQLYAIREATRPDAPEATSFLPAALDADTGWRQTRLNERLGERVDAFRAQADAQADAQGVAMLVATEDDDLKGSRVHLTWRLSETPTDSDWLDLGGVAGTTVDSLRFVPRTGQPPRVLLAGRPEGARLARAWIAEPGAAEVSWQPFHMPMDFEEILDARPGHARGLGQGLYVLYRDRDGRGLVFVSQDRVAGGVPAIRRIPIPPDPTAFDLLPEPGRQGYSELFVACGDALWTLDANEQLPGRGGRQIATLEGQTFTDVFAAKGERGEVSVYVRDSGREVRYLARRLDDAATLGWSPLATMHTDAAVVAPVRTGDHKVNALFVIRQRDRRCTFLWQDDVETVWQENPVIVRDTAHEVPINGTRTRLRFCQADDMPRARAKAQLSATSSAYVRVNGVPVYVEPGHAAAVETDANGALTLELTLDDGAAPPHLSVSADFLDDTIVIDPMATTFERMRGQTAEAVLAAKTRDGEPLVTGEHRDEGRIDAVLGASREMMKTLGAASVMPAGISGASPELLAAQGVRFVPAGADATTRLSLDGLPDGPLWCLDNTGDQLVLLDPAETAAVLADQAGVAALDFGRWIGDALRTVAQTAERLLRATCEKLREGLEFVFTFAKQVIRVVVETAGQVAQTIHTLTKRYLGIDLSKLVDWLGFVFDWGDILKTHDFLRGAVTRTFGALRREVVSVKDQLDGILADLEDLVRDARPLPPDLADGAVEPRHKEMQRVGGDEHAQKIDDTSRVGLNNPAVTWGSQKLLEGLGGMSNALGLPPSLLVTLQRLIDGVTNEVGPELREGFEDVFKTLAEALEGPGATLGSVLEAVGPAALQRFAAQARKVLGVLMDVLADLLEVVEEGATETVIEVPLLSALYRLISNGRGLTLIDLVLLPVAIPTTIVAKLLRGEAPFEGITLPEEPSLNPPAAPDAKRAMLPIGIRTQLSIWMAGLAGFFVDVIAGGVATFEAGLSYMETPPATLSAVLKFLSGACKAVQVAFNLPAWAFTGDEGAELTWTWVAWFINTVYTVFQLSEGYLYTRMAKLVKWFAWIVDVLALVLNIVTESTLTVLRMVNAKGPLDRLNDVGFIGQLALLWSGAGCYLALAVMPKEPQTWGAVYGTGIVLLVAGGTMQICRVVSSALNQHRHVAL
ncbi:MAG: hypothetical protein H6739_35295 [Alphaproteobacteria bacterium]|nr:hypothetical protein [Alphaproteobacteria bacterium]